MGNWYTDDVKYIAGVGEARAKLLDKELGIATVGDLLYHFPFRYIDRTKIYRIAEIGASGQTLVQFRGRVTGVAYAGAGRKRRFTAYVADATGQAELVWFQGIKWIEKRIEVGREYLVFGRPSFFRNELSLVHPEVETVEKALSRRAESGLQGIYSSTERLSSVLGTKGFHTIVSNAWRIAGERIGETLPPEMRRQYGLATLREALYNIHFPQSPEALRQAQYRLKFEELLGVQLNVMARRSERLARNDGFYFARVGESFNTFYREKLPFPLTGAQKRVVHEIRQDTVTGCQMNRLLQGDVGSGKTLVALLSMLLAVDNGFQACMMAPTEILARQHYATLTRLLDGLPVQVAILTGASKARERRAALEGVASGEVQLLVGTHALIEDRVRFANLGLVVIDEQHRFGVEQRARMWTKNEQPPHVLVIQPKRINELLNCLEQDTGRMIVIFEDSDTDMNVLINFNPELTKTFNHRIVLKQYTVNELVEMAKRFARKRQYEVDDDALLELYLKIDKLHNVNDNIKLDDIKEIINQAIVNSERRASRRFFGGLKKKRSENGDVIFLTEADFKDR